LLRLQHQTSVDVSATTHSKLNSKYYGPYKVLQQLGKVAYKLQLLNRVRIHDVFHISLLKKIVGPTPNQVVPLPDLFHGRMLPTPEKVLHVRLNTGVWELLVKWTGRSEANTTWEQLDDFKQ
jgi:hypothetical protein